MALLLLIYSPEKYINYEQYVCLIHASISNHHEAIYCVNYNLYEYLKFKNNITWNLHRHFLKLTVELNEDEVAEPI